VGDCANCIENYESHKRPHNYDCGKYYEISFLGFKVNEKNN
jgi:hypothetical protein